jgi:sugar lactone lactonase YvrE
MLGALLCVDRVPAASELVERPTLRVPVTDSRPVVDGRFEEPCWKDAAQTGPLKTKLGKTAKATTEAFILRDADHLYVGFTCGMTSQAASDEPSKAAEAVELLIDSNGDQNSYYLIRISPTGGGQTLTSYNEHDPPWHDRTWQPQFKAAVAKGAGVWAAELTLPLNIFNKNKTLVSEIGFNIRRSGMPGGETQCWHGAFPNPGDAGVLTGIPARESMPGPAYVTRGLTRWYRPPNEASRSFLAEEGGRTIELGPGSAHPGTTGEVTLELEAFLLAGDPHARGIIWDLAVDEEKGELYVLADTRPVRGVAELRVFDRRGNYLRTIMPLNPHLPRASVHDLCRKTAREAGAELIIPKLFLPWGEPSMYGDWWHHPQKIVLAPNGDLILSNLYRGILWRLKPDGSLPAEGWTSIYHRGRNEPFESTVWTQESWHVPDLKNYMPFHALHYPYFCFGPNGLLYVSAGQSSHPTRLYAYHFEVGESDVRYHWDVTGNTQRGSHVWKCRIHPGIRIENAGSFHGFAEPSGLALDGNHLIVADAGNNRLQVLQQDGSLAASITHFEHKGKQHPLHGPTALAIDRHSRLYVLVGSEKRAADPRVERTLGSVRRAVVAAAGKPRPAPRKLIKLKSWREPKLLAVSGPVDPDTLQIAIDCGASPPLVWVANGAGPGSLLQLAGDDLSVSASWVDSGQALSCPRQSGDQPILNIDPQTGHLYVEDDSNYRLKQYGTVYRIDQQGKVLQKWPPLPFNARSLRGTSPWWTVDYQRHFRYGNEPLFIDSIFGKDGRVYRWKLSRAGVEILRFDRAGTPVPFKATGSNALFVDHTMQVNFWHDVYHGMDVDRDGNIYYVAKVDVDAKSRPVSAYHALRRQVNVYGADGKLKKHGLLVLDCVRGLQVDDDGNLYVVYRPAERPWEDYLALSRFSPTGGAPLWSRRWEGFPGEAQVTNAPCHCTAFRPHQILDGNGYLYAAGKYSVQVFDCETGKLVGEFGGYGNMDCQGPGSKYPHPELPFGLISAVSVWKDRLFVVDALNRRIVKCRIVYGQAKTSS